MRSAAPIALVCLLLLAQWTGFFMVLCVAGPDHIELESAITRCCGPHVPHAGMTGMDGACAGCKDLTIETASAWDPSRRLSTNSAVAVMDACRPGPAAAGEAISAGGRPTPALVPSIAAIPLRC